MSKYTHTAIDAEAVFSRLYNGSALTFEGVCADPDSLDNIYEILESSGAVPNSSFEFVTIKGRDMNARYHLTGNNAYRDNLTILCCPLEGFDNPSALVLWRFNYGGRWFDDVVDNNLRRQAEIDGIDMGTEAA